MGVILEQQLNKRQQYVPTEDEFQLWVVVIWLLMRRYDYFFLFFMSRIHRGAQFKENLDKLNRVQFCFFWEKNKEKFQGRHDSFPVCKMFLYGWLKFNQYHWLNMIITVNHIKLYHVLCCLWQCINGWMRGMMRG